MLDKAAETEDPYERMVYVAAFAVSSYGSSYYRAGSKPFNPLLGETYECVREDKGFRFLAEQVINLNDYFGIYNHRAPFVQICSIYVYFRNHNNI